MNDVVVEDGEVHTQAPQGIEVPEVPAHVYPENQDSVEVITEDSPPREPSRPWSFKTAFDLMVQFRVGANYSRDNSTK